MNMFVPRKGQYRLNARRNKQRHRGLMKISLAEHNPVILVFHR